jgi:hypothetical protein
MTPTEVARRSDALYEDNSGGMTRRTLCDMVAQREAEIEKLRELEDENARLRSCLSDDAENARMIMAENAKMRSICAEVAGILFNLDVDRCGLCDRDSINHPCPVHMTKGGECLIKSELRELGVEVE